MSYSSPGPLGYAEATATISFSGIGLLCINAQKDHRCEAGIIGCERHELIFDIQKITFAADGTIKSSALIPHSLRLEDIIEIKVISPDNTPTSDKAGVWPYHGGSFNRIEDRGCNEDFRWVVDLEGDEFHAGRMRLKRGLNRTNPIILISDGVLYTEKKTDELLARVSAGRDYPPQALGKVGFKTAIDLFCLDGGEVLLSNPRLGGNTLRLPKEAHVKYLITVENLCSVNRGTEGTDFRLFYEVVQDTKDGKQFDLRRIVKRGDNSNPGEVLPGQSDYSLDNVPVVCQLGYLSETDSLL